MSPPLHWRIRHESRPAEQRVPITPAGAAALLRAGHTVTVEESPQRVFPSGDHAAVLSEASAAFSADLLPYLLLFADDTPVRQRSRQSFEPARDQRRHTVEGTHV